MMENKKFLEQINSLTELHYKNSKIFKLVVDKIYKKKVFSSHINDVPFLPVSLFKEFHLKSIPDSKIFKILNSSGTSQTKLSSIYLDKENAYQQTKVLNQIVGEILGPKRLPMIIIDEKENIKNQKNFNAKTAAYIGFSLFGSSHFYLIENGKVNYKGLNSFLQKFASDKFLIFGFTSKIFFQFINLIDPKKLISNSFNKAILIHGGGWKKMESNKISNKKFKEILMSKFKISNVYNYYGLVEQTGSIFFENKDCGFFTTHKFSDVLIRGKNFEVLSKNKKGFVQLISTLPTSYPGHSILTEDVGEIVDVKNCKCGKKTKHFYIHGRVKEAETRGCSDV
mgnify:CR=1 FL=1|tara:strand:- start:32200 stop:33216 length:1017 start_codon:yes stop_codon:yes gene_type:complete